MGLAERSPGPPAGPNLQDYQDTIPQEEMEAILNLSHQLRGLEVLHLNTAAGSGGTAEMLQSLTPLMNSVGVPARWRVVPGNATIAQVSRALRDQLQGGPGEPGGPAWDAYLGHSRRTADDLTCQGVKADVWFMHGPQTLPLGYFLEPPPQAVWVCHLDTTEANPATTEMVLPWLSHYRHAVFSCRQSVLPGLTPGQAQVIPPAIDPFRAKNRHPGPAEVGRVLRQLGLDPARPLIAQVSRFDRWKDPAGVVDAYHMLKPQVKGLQLALVGANTAGDCPGAASALEEARRRARGNPDVHIFAEPGRVGDLEVAAFQAGADVVVQKSIREGFGLAVTEALWKGSPVVGGRCGGIPLQVRDGETGFLVETPGECAFRVYQLLQDPALARSLGRAGRDRVRRQFLAPRLLKDYLRLLSRLALGEAATQRCCPAPGPEQEAAPAQAA